ncbi:MAG: hypothetical protein CMB80_05205 [Flammeovirgaceae bacterium]|nr:hypothetical protein [Flammeovirgaceae bacterium]MBE62707.1 hypothetical protein [Flammeovirgaceae bacterium]HCX20465.1 hypothetical protein [Cytophagales bacterium]
MEKTSKKRKFTNYAFEFITVFTGITVAFLLNTWSENRKDSHTEAKILTEIRNGLVSDTLDMRGNISGHQRGIEACQYFRDLINNKELPDVDPNEQYILLLRDFISIQNKSGYESLKSKGLELISDDSLRLAIIDMYDFNYQVLEKIEEEYQENQFFKNYFFSINDLLATNLVYDEQRRLIQFLQPLKLTKKESNAFLMYLVKIEFNREFIINYYETVIHDAADLIDMIDEELEGR